MGDFEAGLCDCCDNMNICCCSFFCPCIQFGRNVEQLKGNDKVPITDCCANCFIFGFLFLFPLCTYPFFQIPRAILQTYIRQMVRGDIDENLFARDFFTVWCCMCCSIAQEGQHLRPKVYGE